MRTGTVLVLVLLLALAACSPGEKADELSALSKPKPVQIPAREADVDVEELKKCCDEDARAMGAECCQQLDQFLQAHSSMMGMNQPASVQTGRPVQVPDVIAAQWPQVKLRFGPKKAEGQEIVIAVGQKANLTGTPLEVEVVAFLPAFRMSDNAITTDGAEPRNPAVKVVIREEGKPDWTGWLFANMPDVHAFGHETYQVILVAGVKKE